MARYITQRHFPASLRVRLKDDGNAVSIGDGNEYVFRRVTSFGDDTGHHNITGDGEDADSSLEESDVAVQLTELDPIQMMKTSSLTVSHRK